MAGGGSRPGRGRELGQEVALHKAAIYQGALDGPFRPRQSCIPPAAPAMSACATQAWPWELSI